MLTTKEVARRFDVEPTTVLMWTRRGVKLVDGTKVFLPVARVVTCNKKIKGKRMSPRYLTFDESAVDDFAVQIGLTITDALSIPAAERRTGISRNTFFKWIYDGLEAGGTKHKLRTVGRASRRQILLSDLREFLRLVARAKAEQYEAMAERLEGVA